MLKILTLYIFLCVPATSADLFINAMQTIRRSLVPVACFETTDPNSIKIKLLVGTGFLKSGEDVKLNWFRFDRCRANNLLDLAVRSVSMILRHLPGEFSEQWITLAP